MKLLIADDEEIIRRGLKSIDWESIGIRQVLIAEDGARAWEILQNQNIDIVLSDIRMPGLNGLELADYISTHMRNTRVVLLTGFSDFTYAQNAIRFGVADYILKPAKPTELLGVVQKVMKSLQLNIKADEIVREHEQQGDAIVAQQEILHGFRDLKENVTAILFYLTKHYSENISLSTLADVFHFSTIHIGRMVKKETGYSFLDILTCIRLGNAARMLRESSLKVSEICEKVGLGDQRYFSQVFKKVYECTPIEYRKKKSEPKSYTLMELLQQMTKNK